MAQIDRTICRNTMLVQMARSIWAMTRKTIWAMMTDVEIPDVWER